MQGFVVPYLSYYVLLFCSTVLYYSQAYAGLFRFSQIPKSKKNSNPRLLWYHLHHTKILITQILLAFTIIISALVLVIDIKMAIHRITPSHIFIIAVVLITGILYYGNLFFPGQKVSLRVAFIKPFIIGFVWAGITCLFPAVMGSLLCQEDIFTAVTFFTFVDHFIFISILCILFDIKDYEDDSRVGLRTYAVRIGIPKTIRNILLPMTTLYFLIMCIWVVFISLSNWYIVSITITTLLVLGVLLQTAKTKHLLYYLMVVDGLMLTKALLDLCLVALVS